MSLNDWLKAGGGVVLLFMTLVQIAPIKVNPWSAIGKLAGNAMRFLGKTMNKDVMDKLETVENDVKNLKEKHDDLKIITHSARRLVCLSVRIIMVTPSLLQTHRWRQTISYQ